MNVLIFSEPFWPEGSGGELATYLYAKLLAERGVNLRVIASSNFGSSKDEVNGLLVHRIPVRKLTKYTTLGRFPVLLKKPLRRRFERFDLVYMNGWLTAIPLIKCMFRKPMVVHLHSFFPACPIGSSYDLTKNSPCTLNNLFPRCAKCIVSHERTKGRNSSEAMISSLLNSTIGLAYIKFLKYADAIVFVSKAQKNLVLRRLPTIAGRSFVIHNPLPKLPYIPVKGDDVGYFGGISPLKGFHALIPAWSQVYNRYNSRLHISLAEGILKQKATFGKKKIILHGKLSGHAYDEVCKRIKAVLVPSEAPEALPYVVSEGCLRGRITIASRVGGIPEQVEGLDGVRLVEPGNVDELAEAIDEVLSMDKETVVKLGMKNREEILKKFDNSRIGNELICVFEKVSQ